MIIRISGHNFHYECENLCRIFYPDEKINIIYDNSGTDARVINTSYSDGKVFCEAIIDGSRVSLEAETTPENAELSLAQLIDADLTEITTYIPPWGVLTGVRPSKLMRKLIAEKGEDGAVDFFKTELRVTERKTSLALTVAEAEEDILRASRDDSCSVYISIPFCPSRCAYCSFVSHSITNPNARKLLPQYLEKLEEEIILTGNIIKRNGLRIESIYFGGGTPGILEASQIDRLQCAVEKSFNLSNLREYTFELGRPDTVTPEKLHILKLHGTDRISINPQTFRQQTLDIIGRKHTIEQAIKAYQLAGSYNFKCINMDLIAGLPGETYSDFVNSIDTAVILSPENITVHTLALKRSALLNFEHVQLTDCENVAMMLDYSHKKLKENGYSPYYMYRQSKSAGNLENVGWCTYGTEGLYNVYMMEECHSVIGIGAGAVTKLCKDGGSKVERIFNYKYPYEYISGFDIICERKIGIDEFHKRKGVKNDGNQ